MSSSSSKSSDASGRRAPLVGPAMGGITVPPLPPVPGPVSGGRRPLSSEDFEEELDIPEFLKG